VPHVDRTPVEEGADAAVGWRADLEQPRNSAAVPGMGGS
jgi:hypothetical protein